MHLVSLRRSLVRPVGSLVLALIAFAPDARAQTQDDLRTATVDDGLRTSDWSSIREAYDAARHAAVVTAAGFVARNPEQAWVTHFDARGFAARPDDGGWTFGLELESYGFAGGEIATCDPRRVDARGTRVTYEWDDVLEEWWVNDTRGLEHGFTVRSRPSAGDGPLVLGLVVRGELAPRVAADGRSVAFVDELGATIVTYSGLFAHDAAGRELACSLSLGSRGLVLAVAERGAAYPLTIDPLVQQTQLGASNSGANDFFGGAVAIYGDTVVVGATGEDSNATGVNGDQSNNSASNAGAAYVFVRNGTSWSQQAYLKASNTNANDGFGRAMAILGDTLVVSAAGEGSNATGVNGDQSNNAIPGAGATYVFVRNGTTWTQQAYLKASNTELVMGSGDGFGSSVALSGDTLVVGAAGEDSNATGVNGNESDNSADSSGAAYVFVRNGTTWSQEAYLKASNTEANDVFGSSASISGDTVVVGAFWEDSNAKVVNGNQASNTATDAGAAYVFVRNGTVWSQEAYLKAANSGSGDRFGGSIAMSGDTIVVGAPEESGSSTGVNGVSNNSAPAAGAAYVFVRSGTTWSQQAYVKASNTGSDDTFGVSVWVSGDRLFVGAGGEDSNATGVDGDQANNGAADSGAVYVFGRTGSTWSQTNYLKSLNTHSTWRFGASVAADQDTVVVGALFEGLAPGGLYSGAAYVLDLPPRPELYCVAKTDSLGCVPQIGWTGYLAATSSDFHATATSILGQTTGLLAWGRASNAPLQTAALKSFPTGILGAVPCVFRPARTAVQASGGTLGACDGTFDVTLDSAWLATNGFVAGETVYCTFVYADPNAPDGSGWGHTAALSVEVLP